jgi:hypothetical protein
MTDNELVLWNHVIDPGGLLWRWKARGSSIKHSVLRGFAEDEGLIRADHPVGALRWLVTDGPVYGYGELDFHEEFTITIGPADDPGSGIQRRGRETSPGMPDPASVHKEEASAC